MAEIVTKEFGHTLCIGNCKAQVQDGVAVGIDPDHQNMQAYALIADGVLDGTFDRFGFRPVYAKCKRAKLVLPLQEERHKS
ncbi:MAG: hypothetical protein IPN64_00145 [Propionivibrio sp.]|nr:hypothetical protein [Propionivibrio sp.]